MFERELFDQITKVANKFLSPLLRILKVGIAPNSHLPIYLKSAKGVLMNLTGLFVLY